jgi:hypothetical protein
VTALLAATSLPHVFGGILVESPSLWVGEGRFLGVSRSLPVVLIVWYLHTVCWLQRRSACVLQLIGALLVQPCGSQLSKQW